ncbi:GyrI-like domain-containing protein [Halobacillus salinus]|uniref:AraC family transcriptional regulator n=1 Tax=Halobacillus salinus TaxID=192814 RepID=A0A4Z0H4P9_9BACI|nr:GyrI-like domain-containing protein [Halobacillus salinus]TGB04431.1 AraC family transcriptional regulator [Halobacillus salinus]
MKLLIQEAANKSLPALKLVGFRVLCRSGEEYVEEIPKAVDQLFVQKSEIPHVVTSNGYYGVFMVDACHPDVDGYWVCMEVGEFGELPEGMEELTIPEQTYATITYQGPHTYIMKAYRELHDWISKKGCERLLNTWHLEKYSAFPSSDKHLDVELYDTIRRGVIDGK